MYVTMSIICNIYFLEKKSDKIGTKTKKIIFYVNIKHFPNSLWIFEFCFDLSKNENKKSQMCFALWVFFHSSSRILSVGLLNLKKTIYRLVK